MGLELYAEIEPLLGFDEEVAALHDLFLELLAEEKPGTLIDIGCGSGEFLKRAKEALNLRRAYGVDLSETMIRRARKAGVEADAKNLCDVKERFDAATAVFDVLNYIPSRELSGFLECVAEVLVPGGLFVADVNTLVGFEEVAEGSLIRSFDDRLLAIESAWEPPRLVTRIDFFRKERDGCYRRESDRVVQYHHKVEELATACDRLELVRSYAVRMYAEEPDKEVLLFRRTG